MEQQTVTIKNFSRIENPDIHYRRMTYPPERGYVDFNKGIIYELKPGNPKGVQQGIRQLDKYIDKFNTFSPLNGGRRWEGVIELY